MLALHHPVLIKRNAGRSDWKEKMGREQAWDVRIDFPLPVGLYDLRTRSTSLRTDAEIRSSMSPAQRKAGRPYS